MEENVNPKPAENQNESNQTEDSGTNVINEVRKFLHSIAHIKDEVDYKKTLDGIERDIVFKGYNIWILIASIFIASIGLNANSAAVIIGAMLISPLMGPIVGLGMSMATNNWNLMMRALKNMSVFVLVSVVASSIYFMMTPLEDAASELIGRTKPNFLDVLVAFFGGVAGIVAGSRSEKTNVIPGVAIATALMPPLCTAGYGLANLNFDYFTGAFYLFLINCVFIALSTFLVARYLKFPRFSFVDPKREKRVKLYFFLCLLLFLAPSVKTLIDTYKESRFNTNISEFVEREIKPIYHFPTVESNIDSSYIIVSTSEFIEKSRLKELQGKLVHYDLEGVKLRLMSQVDYERLNQVKNTELSNAMKELDRQYAKIRTLESTLDSIKGDTVAFSVLEREVQALFPNLNNFAYSSELISSSFKQRDTIPTLILSWNEQEKGEEEKLINWLKIELKKDSIKVLHE